MNGIPGIMQRINRLYKSKNGIVFSQCSPCRKFKFYDAPQDSKWYSEKTLELLLMKARTTFAIQPNVSHAYCPLCGNKELSELRRGEEIVATFNIWKDIIKK